MAINPILPSPSSVFTPVVPIMIIKTVAITRTKMIGKLSPLSRLITKRCSHAKKVVYNYHPTLNQRYRNNLCKE